MRVIDLNVDIGEGAPFDQELIKLASSANVCCGAHAGSPELTRETVALCQQAKVRIGAHPGYPDQPNFGRKMVEDPNSPDLLANLKQQIDLIPEADYIKPHGAWYNHLASNPTKPEVQLLKEMGKPIMLLAGSPLADIREGFADRGYAGDKLIPRSQLGALLETPEEAVAQALSLADRTDSLCLHGDGLNALKLLERVRIALEAAGFVIGPK